MSQQANPAIVVIGNLVGPFFQTRGLEPRARGLESPPAADAYTSDKIVSDMEQALHVRVDAQRARPRGARDWVVVLVLSPKGKYSQHAPDLRTLLKQVESDALTKSNRLDELIVVAEAAFFVKKNLAGVVRETRQTLRGGAAADPDGLAPRVNAYPFHNFALVVPEHVAVPPHRVMADDEVALLLQRERLSLADLDIIFATDPPIVWNGGREGQVVEITVDSQIAGVAVHYRRIAVAKAAV